MYKEQELLSHFQHNYEDFTKSVINCLPKGDKSRELLKNWCPILLLSVLYKLTSATLANRMKKVLDKLISDFKLGS